jgi:serine/threonine protein kinase
LDPSVISHYTILEKLGEGGMGIVYKAQDTKLDRLVAVKVLPHHLATNEAERARFLQEAKAASALNHPNVCTIYDIKEENDHQFIVMEFVAGTTLREKLPIQKVQDAVTYALQIGDALHEAHGNGIVHRDIKCENIMVNAKNQIKVMDFGLAKLKGSLKLTKTSSTVGTLAYMAPEQIQASDVDARSDIFSFGVVMFEMLTGHLPFRGEHEAAMMYSILNEEPLTVEQYRSDVPQVFSNLIERCLEKDPADRFQTAGEVVVELRRVQKQSARVHRSVTLPIPPALPEPPPRTTEKPHAGNGSRHPRKFLWLVAALFLVLAAIAAYKFIPGFSHTQQFQQMKITRLTNSGKVSQAAVSPDGKYIVYAQEAAGKQSLWMRQTATTSNVQIVPPSDAKYFKTLFSRDANFIYMLKAEKEGALAHLYSMPVLGGQMRKLIHNVNDFTLSPEGNQIGFIRYTIGDATFEVKIAGADGTGERSLGQRKAPLSYDALAWSPNAASITCALVDVNNVSVVSMPVDGSPSKPIATYEWNTITSMEWLPDGSGIVIVPQDLATSAGAQIWEIAYPSGETRRITNDLNNYTSISLTADAKSLVTSEMEFHSAVWRLPAIGAGRNGWNTDLAKQVR